MEAAGITLGYDVAMVELPTYVENLRMSTDGQDKENIFLKQNSGSSLIEVVISVAVIGFLVTAISTFVTGSSEQKVKIAYSAARDSIYNKAVAAISNRQVLTDATQSRTFRNCWLGVDCRVTNKSRPGEI